MEMLPRHYDTTSGALALTLAARAARPGAAAVTAQPPPLEGAQCPACESERLLDLGARPGEHVGCARCGWPVAVPNGD